MKIYRIEVAGRKGMQTGSLPFDAKILSAKSKYNRVFLWFASEGYSRNNDCSFYITPTDDKVPPEVVRSMKFIDTILLDSDQFEGHIFASKRFVN